MKSNLYLISFTVIVFIILGTILFFHLTFAHEEAHKQFAIYNGCKEYDISYFYKPHFQCLNYIPSRTIEQKENQYMLDSMNEIASYNMTTTWMAILLTGFAMCSVIILVYHDFKKQFAK